MTLGVIYLVAMLSGAFLFRVPAPGWQPAGWQPPTADRPRALITRRHVHVDTAIKTAPFYLLWAVLFLNVTAGIGDPGAGLAHDPGDVQGRSSRPSAAAGFVGLLSLFNMAGRFGWSSLSDRIGRKATYAHLLHAGPAAVRSRCPTRAGSAASRCSWRCAALILTMYGGGFATIPAYLSDMFGTQYVGAIHGRLLTAWSAAGVAGPVLVNYIREYQIERGVPAAQAYNITMYLMAGLLVLGLLLPISRCDRCRTGTTCRTRSWPGRGLVAARSPLSRLHKVPRPEYCSGRAGRPEASDVREGMP